MSSPHKIIASVDEEDEQDENMPDITFEPPTPFEAGASLRFDQGNRSIPDTLSAYNQSTLGDHSTTFDHTFAWQDSLSQDSSSNSRPTSTSGWSVSGTSASGDEPLSTAIDHLDSSAGSPLQAGKSKSHARKKAPGHVSRPRNAFILFRSHAITNQIIPPSLGVKDNRAVSCIVATLWKSLPDEERQQWKSEAEKEKLLHRKQYPNYQFKPGNCGIKGKVRAHAKTEEAVKEQCEVIADQILRSHGRSSSRSSAREDGAEAKRKKKSAAAALKRASRNKDDLPRIRRGSIFPKEQIDLEKENIIRVKDETDYDDIGEAEEYIAPISLPVSRRRSLSFPSSVSDSNVDMFASWQARIEQDQKNPTLGQGDDINQQHHQSQSLAGRRSHKPTALRFTLPTSFGDASFTSPRTLTSGLSISAPSPRYSLYNVTDQAPTLASPITARQSDYQIGTDAMLLSPLKSSFHDARSGSIGWQSWSRYSYADIALPILKSRSSIGSISSRRNSLLLHRPSQSLYQDINDIFPQTDNISAHLSLHHNFFSPTMQTFNHRYTDYKSHSEDQNQDEEMQDDSKTSDADTTTPSLSQLALYD